LSFDNTLPSSKFDILTTIRIHQHLTFREQHRKLSNFIKSWNSSTSSNFTKSQNSGIRQIRRFGCQKLKKTWVCLLIKDFLNPRFCIHNVWHWAHNEFLTQKTNFRPNLDPPQNYEILTKKHGFWHFPRGSNLVKFREFQDLSTFVKFRQSSTKSENVVWGHLSLVLEFPMFEETMIEVKFEILRI